MGLDRIGITPGSKLMLALLEFYENLECLERDKNGYIGVTANA